MPDSVGNAILVAMTKNKAVSRSVKIVVSLAAVVGVVQAGSGASTAPRETAASLHQRPCDGSIPFSYHTNGSTTPHMWSCSNAGTSLKLD